MTSPEPKTPQSAERDIPDTEVIVVPAGTPVFVDSTGRRRRLLQRLAYAFGAVCVLYGGLISVSLAGGPVSSSAILPVPDLPDHENQVAEARPSPTPDPILSVPPKPPLIGEPLSRRSAPVSRQRPVTIKPPAPPKTSARPTKSPAPAASTRPAATTKPPTSAPTPTPTVSTPVVVPKPPVVPVPPAPPSTSDGDASDVNELSTADAATPSAGLGESAPSSDTSEEA